MLSSEVHFITGELYRLVAKASYLKSPLTVPVDLETYFCRSFAFSLLLVATIMLFFTGSIPLSSSITEPISMDDSDPKAPYAVPIVRITTLFHTASLIYCYIRYMNSGQVGFALGAVGYGLLAAMGLWCILFATSEGKISRRTGADKRTSGFPFKNAEAYNKKRDKMT
jgi:glutathione S-transferase